MHLRAVGVDMKAVYWLIKSILVPFIHMFTGSLDILPAGVNVEPAPNQPKAKRRKSKTVSLFWVCIDSCTVFKLWRVCNQQRFIAYMFLVKLFFYLYTEIINVWFVWIYVLRQTQRVQIETTFPVTGQDLMLWYWRSTNILRWVIVTFIFQLVLWSFQCYRTCIHVHTLMYMHSKRT